VRLLYPIVRVLIGYMDGFRHHLLVRDPVTPQFVRHDLPGLTTVCFQQAFEEALGSSSIPPNLQKHINNFTVLVNDAPEIVLLAVDLHENLIDEKGIAETLVLSFQSPCIFGATLDTPEADRLVADCDTAFSE
jgi:hypothetical protein